MKSVLVASGRASFSGAGTTRLRIELTTAGKRLLKGNTSLKLTAEGTFTPPEQNPVTLTKVFVLKQ